MAAKVCVVCGADVSSQRRVKDPQGNYYCQVCYDAKLADRRARATGNPEVDFECGTCRRFFAVEDVYDEGGTIICKACFATRVRPSRKTAEEHEPAAAEASMPAAPESEPALAEAPAKPAAEAALPLAVSQPETPQPAAPEIDLAPAAPEPVANAGEPEPPPFPHTPIAAVEWHVHDKGQSLGPFPEPEFLAAVRRGDFSTAASIWKEGMGDWSPIIKLEQALGYPLSS